MRAGSNMASGVLLADSASPAERRRTKMDLSAGSTCPKVVHVWVGVLLGLWVVAKPGVSADAAFLSAVYQNPKPPSPVRILHGLLNNNHPANNHSNGVVTGRHSASASSLGATNARTPKQDLYIGGFFPLSENPIEAALGRGVKPAIELAIQHINDNPEILRDYKLRLYFNDTQCSASVGMKAFFDMMDRPPHKLMILGGSCTAVTDPIAKTAKHWHMTLLSYADTHPMFTKKGYPNFFRIVPSENAYNAPRLHLLKRFNWTCVGTIYQNEPRFALAQNALVAELDAAGIVIAESQGFVDELNTSFSKLIEKDVRIIFGHFNTSWARKVFCEVYKRGLYGRRYQWLVAGPRQEHWWTEPDPSMNCSSQDLVTALQGAILVHVLPLTSSIQTTVSGLTAAEYEAQYNMVRGSEYSQFHGYAYDAIWAIALTIEAVSRKLRHRHVRPPNNSAPPSSSLVPTGTTWKASNISVADFRYRDAFWEKLFLEALRKTAFEGVTGTVSFVDNERKGGIIVKQIQGLLEVNVGEFDSRTETLTLFQQKGRTISWIGKTPPKDRTNQIIEPMRINISIFAILAAASVVGIIVSISFLWVNIHFRNQRFIKMSSPYLNNLIIIGCLLTYTSVILLGLDSHLTSEAALPVICTARVWTLMAGFTLAFGSMFSKTWRVHSIFKDVKLNKKAIKDYQLFMVVGILLTVDIAILSTWQIIDPFFRQTKLLDPYLDANNEDIEIRPETEYCKSQHMTIFVGCIYAYKGLLMVFGCFLAWETRNVNIPALNDSKYIGMSVYNVVIMCVIGAPISFILSDQQDASFIIISVFIIFCTTGTLCLVFVPKLVQLRRNPQGTIEKRGRATIKPTMPSSTKASCSNSALDSFQRAKTKNTKLRKEIRSLEEQIQALLGKLGNEEAELLHHNQVHKTDHSELDGRMPSLSVADTVSLASLISSPETTCSPDHVKNRYSEEKANEADKTEVFSGNAHVWSAISHPLLLISQVLRKSVEQDNASVAGENEHNSTRLCDTSLTGEMSLESAPLLIPDSTDSTDNPLTLHVPQQFKNTPSETCQLDVEEEEATSRAPTRQASTDALSSHSVAPSDNLSVGMPVSFASHPRRFLVPRCACDLRAGQAVAVPWCKSADELPTSHPKSPHWAQRVPRSVSLFGNLQTWASSASHCSGNHSHFSASASLLHDSKSLSNYRTSSLECHSLDSGKPIPRFTIFGSGSNDIMAPSESQGDDHPLVIAEPEFTTTIIRGPSIASMEPLTPPSTPLFLVDNRRSDDGESRFFETATAPVNSLNQANGQATFEAPPYAPSPEPKSGPLTICNERPCSPIMPEMEFCNHCPPTPCLATDPNQLMRNNKAKTASQGYNGKVKAGRTVVGKEHGSGRKSKRRRQSNAPKRVGESSSSCSTSNSVITPAPTPPAAVSMHFSNHNKSPAGSASTKLWQQQRLGGCQSVPDVSRRLLMPHHTERGDSSPSSTLETDFNLDLSILPIFQKLLMQKQQDTSSSSHSAASISANVLASCPNISIKCDIVEYL